MEDGRWCCRSGRSTAVCGGHVSLHTLVERDADVVQRNGRGHDAGLVLELDERQKLLVRCHDCTLDGLDQHVLGLVVADVQMQLARKLAQKGLGVLLHDSRQLGHRL